MLSKKKIKELAPEAKIVKAKKEGMDRMSAAMAPEGIMEEEKKKMHEEDESMLPQPKIEIELESEEDDGEEDSDEEGMHKKMQHRKQKGKPSKMSNADGIKLALILNNSKVSKS